MTGICLENRDINDIATSRSNKTTWSIAEGTWPPSPQPRKWFDNLKKSRDNASH